MAGTGRTRLESQLEVLCKKARYDRYAFHFVATVLNFVFVIFFLTAFKEYKTIGLFLLGLSFFVTHYEAKLIRIFLHKDSLANIYNSCWEEVKSHLLHDITNLPPDVSERISAVLKNAKKRANGKRYFDLTE